MIAKRAETSGQTIMFDWTGAVNTPPQPKPMPTCQYPGCTNHVPRAGAKWCSEKCRKKASYHRVKANSRLPQRLGALQDISTVRKFSHESADNLLQIRALVGDEIGDMALDAVWALLVAFNVDLDAVTK
jgi:hypothetical protein